MEYWRLRDEKDKVFLVVYGFKMTCGIENKTKIFTESTWFDSLEQAYEYAKTKEFSEILEWFKYDFMVSAFLRDYYSKKWNGIDCVYIFKDFVKKEYQFFSDVYSLMFLVAKYDLIERQHNFLSANHNYYLKHVFNPSFYDRLCTRKGYKRIGYVDFEKGVYR